MLRLLLPMLLIALAPGDDGGKLTAAEIQRAHEMLAGSWQFVSITDNGQTLGPRLVETRFARDGVVNIVDRQFNIVNPITGDKRVATYRIDPSKNPRRIDLMTRDDRLLRGIYKFEDDQLVIWLQPEESKAIPNDFSAPESSELIMIRLKALSQTASSSAKTESRNIPKPVTPPTRSRPSESVVDQGPNEGELRRAHELLSGSWDILSMTDDGEVLGPDLIRAKFAENGRVQIGTHKLAIVSPNGGDRRLSAIRIDPSKSPSQVDVTTQFDEVLKGIYQFNGDQLIVCLAKRDDDNRPTAFEAPAGSSDLLLKLRMAKAQSRATESAPAPAAVREVARPVTKPAEKPVDKDEQIRQRIVGAWALDDNQGHLALVFRTDGTFTATRTWRSGLKRLFEGNATTSDGRWTYGRGLLDAVVTSTMDPRLLSRSYNYWVQSIGDDTMVVKSLFGQLRTARRLR